MTDLYWWFAALDLELKLMKTIPFFLVAKEHCLGIVWQCHAPTWISFEVTSSFSRFCVYWKLLYAYSIFARFFVFPLKRLAKYLCLSNFLSRFYLKQVVDLIIHYFCIVYRSSPYILHKSCLVQDAINYQNRLLQNMSFLCY